MSRIKHLSTKGHNRFTRGDFRNQKFTKGPKSSLQYRKGHPSKVITDPPHLPIYPSLTKASTY